MRAAVIGTGKIGTRLAARLEERRWSVYAMSPSGRALGNPEPGFRNPRLGTNSVIKQVLAESPNIVFLPISTRDNGQAAMEYIKAFADKGIPVVTSEKGSFAYFPDVLMPLKDGIGYTAVVATGTRMLPYLHDQQLGDEPVILHVVLNGTLNYLLDQASQGRALGAVCEEAERIGYAEPGASGPLSLIQGELQDVRMKVCAFFNILFARKGRYLKPPTLNFPEFGDKELVELSDRAAEHRMVVTLTNRSDWNTDPSDYLFGGFAGGVNNWKVSGGFRRVARDPMFLRWLPAGVDNAVHIIEGRIGEEGARTLSGPGAGLGPTTSTMIKDAERLCKVQKGD